MFGMPIVEVAIGLCFVYLLLAVICSTINETIAGITGRRADLLEKGINSLLADDPELKKRLLDHPLITSLSQGGGARPSYIPASKFALALMDIITGDGKEANDSVALRAGMKKVGKTGLQQSLATVLADGRRNLASDQEKIEAWYNECMDRVSGWYKRHTQIWIWILAACVTLALDADTVQIFKVLWKNQGVRSAVVESAKARLQAPHPESVPPLSTYQNQDKPKQAVAYAPESNQPLTKAEREQLSELVSWPKDYESLSALLNEKNGEWKLVGSLLLHILGWIFTMAAVSLGAPFWFDILKKFMNVRASGRSPEEAPLNPNLPAKAAA